MNHTTHAAHHTHDTHDTHDTTAPRAWRRNVAVARTDAIHALLDHSAADATSATSSAPGDVNDPPPALHVGHAALAFLVVVGLRPSVLPPVPLLQPLAVPFFCSWRLFVRPPSASAPAPARPAIASPPSAPRLEQRLLTTTLHVSWSFPAVRAWARDLGPGTYLHLTPRRFLIHQ
jgi:hypothetical protein